MNAVEIEQAISELAEQPFDAAEFAYQFLIAFGNKDTTIRRLRDGNTNRSDISKGVLQRTNIHIATCALGEVNSTLAALKASPETAKSKAKFILATDGDELHAEDLNSGETVACDYANFANHFGFFLPLAGISTVKQIRDNPIDIQATSRLNRLYVELLKTNEDWAATERRHDMNQFMGRLIFCYFAEDTNIFNGDDLFTKTVEQMSDSKSDNTDHVLKELFRAMDTPFNDRSSSDIPRWADAMPYVNGGLFAGTRDVPKFTRAARSYLLHAGNLNWKEINPDIFGSMIQAVADDEERGALGMHYTSVPNILKVLNPLFLDDLRAQLGEAGDNTRKLLNLKKRMARIRVFDPACGSGNFLVIAYKEMRAIECEINQRRGEANLKSEIPLSNFRGIEIREFPAEIARLALIVAEFQCDVLYRGQKDALQDFLPLDDKNWIVCGNALRLDWWSICPPTGTAVKHASEDLFHTPLDQTEIEFENEGGETFICGNPPYLGDKVMSVAHKEDIERLLSQETKKWRSLDYVSGWFIKAAIFSERVASRICFVSTNSICQGQQVPILWPILFRKGLAIRFAYTSFKWSNLAAHNAGVIVVIVGLGTVSQDKSILFEFDKRLGETNKKVTEISPYLIPGKSVIVSQSKKTISPELSQMTLGNVPKDGGNLLINLDEIDSLGLVGIQKLKFVRPIFGSSEYIRGNRRYCIWVRDEDLPEALSVLAINDRIKAVKNIRLASPDKGANDLAERAHQFREMNESKEFSIIVPRVSSINREYLPAGVLNSRETISDSAFGLYDPLIWNLSILLSRLHLQWIATVCGKLKTDFRYSNVMGWNTFPVPKLTEKNKDDLTRSAEDILLEREAHFPATIADLYDPDNMPENLRAAHDRNDEVLERIYIGRRFKNDTERLEKLFELYTKMTTTSTATERVS